MKAHWRRLAGKTRSAAFTLIELLVVIAIISLLVSILLPSLQKAKDLAKQTMCLSNLKQFHFAFMCYADDNQEIVISCPRDPFDPENKLDWCWPSYLTKYFDMPPRDYTSDPAQPWGMSWVNSPVNSIFHCPGANPTDVSYSLNFDLGFTLTDGASWSHPLSDENKNGSHCMRMGDTGIWWFINSGIAKTSDPATVEQFLATRHSSGGNYLFCDGHVEWVPAMLNIWHWNNAEHSVFLYDWN